AGITDVRAAVQSLFAGIEEPVAVDMEHDDRAIRIRIGTDSSITVPREWNEKLTDLTLVGPHVEALMQAHRSLAALSARSRPAAAVVRNRARCGIVEDVTINDVFYREQPHLMRRYSALAFDNIRRDPVSFLEAALYRVYRVFVVVGSKDKWTNQQFRGATA